MKTNLVLREVQGDPVKGIAGRAGDPKILLPMKYFCWSKYFYQPAVLEVAEQLRCPAMKAASSAGAPESVIVVQVRLVLSQCHLSHTALAATEKYIFYTKAGSPAAV